ncbi:unnamed protein product [Ambrosiozyma monospora]|uniref:Unnamed protein product n=1 Tax=Ambrosiozyma monospora TaxID=43982 RepID=A0ACB5TMV2_AMBMO|nr:unnamed protein product [Ambrosiozyma monospora]
MNLTNTTTSIQPTAFYDASSVLINYNTQVFIGGKASSGFVGMKQLALWQYQSWGFKTASFADDTSISARKSPLLLPIVESDSFNQDYVNNNFTDFSISSALMIGGEISDGSNSSPNFATINLSGSTWTWESLDTTVSVANAKKNSAVNAALDLDDILGAAMIYDTLVVIANTTTSGTITKRQNVINDSDDGKFFLKLYNTTNLQAIESVDYTALNTEYKKKQKSNKGLIIALSTIIPLLAVIIVGILAIIMYRRHLKKRQDEENEKEIKDIMEFYQGGHHPNNSTSTVPSSSSSESTNEKSGQHAIENTYFGGSVKINNFDDGDNLSISSWRRKREEYMKEQHRKHLPFSLPSINKGNNSNNGFIISDTDEDLKNSSGSFIKRSLSTVSSQLGKSLRRNKSIQSSLRSFVTAKETFDDEEASAGILTPEPQSPSRNTIHSYHHH